MTQKEKLIELLGKLYEDKFPFDSDDEVADYLLEDGVIAPPCKVGDTVYAVALNTEKLTCEIHRGYISCITIRSTGNYIVICHEGLDDESDFNKIFGKFDDFGKFIFFTKEEAEAALKERVSNQ